MLCNWFAFAPHASQEAGRGMLGAHLARAIIDAAQGEPAESVQHALQRSGVSQQDRLVAEKMADTLRWFGLSHDVAASLGPGGTAMRCPGPICSQPSPSRPALVRLEYYEAGGGAVSQLRWSKLR